MAKSKKSVKKVDNKMVEKTAMAEALKAFLINYVGNADEVRDGADYGFKGMSFIVNGLGDENISLQIAISAPKVGQTNYDYRLEDAEEADE